MKKRPNWNDYFMQIAYDVAARSTCKMKDVGAVIVKENKIISTGYNGAPEGLDHCTENGCYIKKVGDTSEDLEDRCRRTVHAEQNALIQSDGSNLNESTLYTTHYPCFTCAKMIINSGIEKVVYDNSVDYEDSIEFLENSNVELEKLS